MLIVQTFIGSVETERMNGSSQCKYHGYTTDAQKSGAIGQEKAAEDDAADLFLIHIAARKPVRTANPATSCGVMISLPR